MVVAIYLWLGGVCTYAFLRAYNIIGEPAPRKDVETPKETDYEMFRRESVRNGFSFDGIHNDAGNYFITKENCPPLPKVTWAWNKVPVDTLSMKKVLVVQEVDNKKVERVVRTISLNEDELYCLL